MHIKVTVITSVVSFLINVVVELSLVTVIMYALRHAATGGRERG